MTNVAPVLKRNLFRGVAVALVAIGLAEVCYPSNCRGGDSPMICAWRRTFYAQDGLKSPLRGYFMPRRPNCDCWGGSYGSGESTAVGSDGIAPAQFVRLGQIPNDLQLIGPAAPGPVPGH